MSLLHATWLYPPEGAVGGRLLLWADTWRVAAPLAPADHAPEHPLTLDWDSLATLLEEHDLWSEALRPAQACL
ncbi:MAG: hypothetical protein ACKOZW_14555, partial [Cyanobium sp.]